MNSLSGPYDREESEVQARLCWRGPHEFMRGMLGMHLPIGMSHSLLQVGKRSRACIYFYR